LSVDTAEDAIVRGSAGALRPWGSPGGALLVNTNRRGM
jgi:hypothetical protein